jgi:hypothetical protein
MLLQLELILKLKILQLMIKYLKCKFGILLDSNDLKILHQRIIKVLLAFYLFTLSLIRNHLIVLKSG